MKVARVQSVINSTVALASNTLECFRTYGRKSLNL